MCIPRQCVRNKRGYRFYLYVWRKEKTGLKDIPKTTLKNLVVPKSTSYSLALVEEERAVLPSFSADVHQVKLFIAF
jgi:hypothetical protein